MKKLKTWRFALLYYMIISFVIGGIFIATHFTNYQIDWTRYSDSQNYRDWADNILENGTARINGNLTALHSPLLIILLTIGVMISLLVFFFGRRPTFNRSIFPLLALIGFLIPFFSSGANLLPQLIFSVILIFINTLLTTLDLK